MLIEYFDESTNPTIINQNPLSRWMKWIKMGFYLLIGVIIAGLFVKMLSLINQDNEQIDIVDMVREAVVKVYPKLDNVDGEI
jgi:hypothetical protein